MRLLTLLFFFLSGFASVGQILHPAKWTYTVSNSVPQTGDEIDLVFSVSIEKNWYLYSNEFVCEDGPTKTEINFKPHPSYQLVGKLQAIHPIEKHDPIFECDIKIFKGTGEFRQKIKILQKDLLVTGEYEYQVCSDVDGKCIPFNEDFSFNNIKVSGSTSPIPRTDFQIKQSKDSLPIDEKPAIVIPSADTFNGPVIDKSILDGVSGLSRESLLGYLIFAFVVGLTSLITPCVFPMIPMTVTFFLKEHGENRLEYFTLCAEKQHTPDNGHGATERHQHQGSCHKEYSDQPTSLSLPVGFVYQLIRGIDFEEAKKGKREHNEYDKYKKIRCPMGSQRIQSIGAEQDCKKCSC